jgi:hypothetical protein
MAKATAKKRLPSWNLPAIFQLRDKLASCVDLLCLCDEEMSEEMYAELVAHVHHQLPPRITYETVEASCEPLLGEVLTEDGLYEFAWRLAGNLPRLRARHPVLPWSGIPKAEWMPMQVLEVEYEVTHFGKTAAKLHLQVLAGMACPMQVEKLWTTRYCHFVAPRLGFSRWATDRYPFQDTQELTGFRFCAEVVAGEHEVQFERVEIPSSCRVWNQRLVRLRARDLQGFKCPRKFHESKPCFKCSFGQDRCPAAVRPRTLVKQHCNDCGSLKFFDPEHQERCIRCDQKMKRDKANDRRKEKSG